MTAEMSEGEVWQDTGPGTIPGLQRWVRTVDGPNLSSKINQSLIFLTGNIHTIALLLMVFFVVFFNCCRNPSLRNH